MILCQNASANATCSIVSLEVGSLNDIKAPQFIIRSIDLVPISLPLPLLSIPHHWVSVDIDSASDPAVTPPEAEVTHPLSVVALGGTFDHLHPGHKILLSIAAWLANQKVIVGVSDHALLSSKSNAHILESLETRQANVRSFLEMFKSSRVQTPMDKGFEYDIVMINDTYGPTGTDPNIQGLVVSRETVGGAEKSAYALHIISCKLLIIKLQSLNIEKRKDFQRSRRLRSMSFRIPLQTRKTWG